MKINEIIVEGPTSTGVLSRLGSKVKSLMPGKHGGASKLEYQNKLATKKISDGMFAELKSSGALDPATNPKKEVTIDQAAELSLFPDIESKKLLKAAWKAAGYENKSVPVNLLPKIAMQWVLLFKKSTATTEKEPEAVAPAEMPANGVTVISPKTKKVYRTQEGQWFWVGPQNELPSGNPEPIDMPKQVAQLNTMAANQEV